MTAAVVPFPYRTVAEISLRAILKNLHVLRGETGKEVLPVVKADAYGHGMVPVVRALVNRGAVRMVCVANLDEALELRRRFPQLGILVLSGFFPHQIDAYVRYRITPLVHTLAHLQSLVGRAKLPDVHLKVDSGLRRLGIQPEELHAALQAVERMGTKLSGIATHFADGEDIRSDFVDRQIEVFEAALAQFRERKLLHTDARIHVANSGGALRKKLSVSTAVRPGIALYGSAPHPRWRDLLVPALTWKTRILALKQLKKGDTVGYGRTYRAKKREKVAVLPIGYADGYRRAFSGRGEVLLGGKRVPVRGRVSMDLVTVDVTGLSVREGAEAILIGKVGKESIFAEELADWADTIAYEIFCGISSRVPRIYLD
jgi:alanine racemase